MYRLSFLVVVFLFTLSANAKSKDKEEEIPETSFSQIIEYGEAVLAKKKPEPITDTMLKPRTVIMRYYSERNGKAMVILREDDWTVVYSFFPDGALKVPAKFKLSGVISKVEVFPKKMQSNNTIWVTLEDVKSKRGKGSRGGKKVSFLDLAEMAEDYYSIPKGKRDDFSFPKDKIMPDFKLRIYSTNSETRMLNFVEREGNWKFKIKVRADTKLKQGDRLEIKKPTIKKVECFRKGKNRVGTISIRLYDVDIN